MKQDKQAMQFAKANWQSYQRLAKHWKEYVQFPGRAVSYSFYANLLARFGVKKALDVGCGVGDHAIELAKGGIEMAMCDMSPEMIRQAGKNAHEVGLVIDAKVADWKALGEKYTGESFDAAIQTLNSVAVNLTEGHLRRNFESVNSVLRQGGIYVFDIRNPEIYGQPVMIDNAHFRVEPRAKKAGLVELVVTYKPTNETARLYVRKWTPVSILSNLKLAGFGTAIAYHDYKGGQKQPVCFPANVASMQMVAVKS